MNLGVVETFGRMGFGQFGGSENQSVDDIACEFQIDGLMLVAAHSPFTIVARAPFEMEGTLGRVMRVIPVRQN